MEFFKNNFRVKNEDGPMKIIFRLDGPSKEELKQYFKYNKNKFLQAKEYPAEKLGLEFKSYRISKDLRNKKQKKQSEIANFSCIEEDIIVEVEKKTKYLTVSNGDEEMMFDLILFKGVSNKDIIEKSPRFIEYAYLLKRLGKL
ncbi:hypothetical protein [Wukongibacter sp. M2B1]|uniref:hypothetical protein n=1 Tax=Wukongibacter sp. M2B1 TaxID=3088895 RepID=UPI003D7AA4AA